MKNNINFFLLLSVLLGFSSTIQAKEKINVGLIFPERPPYYWIEPTTNVLSGLYIDLLTEISKNTNIEFTYQFLPQGRLRKYLLKGEIDLEPGIDINWRQTEEEKSSSVYSRVFMQSDEVLVFSDSAYIKNPTPEKLSQLDGCGIIGFNLMKNNSIVDGQKLVYEQQIFHMLQKNRCHFALVPVLVLNHWMKNERVKLKYSKPVKSYALRLRLTLRHQYLLPKINQVINEMINDGRMVKLISKY